MKKNKEILKLQDFLDIENLENCKFPDLELALENIIDGDSSKDILYHLDNLCYSVFKTIPCNNKERHLLRFVKFPPKDKWDGPICPIIRDIKNNTITLSSPKGFNDPMDPIIRTWIAEKRKEKKFENKIYKYIDKILDKIRICCLVDLDKSNHCLNKLFGKENKSNLLMWAHYADSHRGICIQYKIDASNLLDTKDEIIRLLDINYNKSFPINGNVSFKDSLIVKSKDWEYEKETRLIMYSRNEKNYYCQLENYKIEAIYMGCLISSEKRNELITLLNDSNIKLYQMKFSNDDITRLEAREIKRRCTKRGN